MKGKIVQITSVGVPPGPSNGFYVLHTALTDSGELWQLYDGDRFSNVPADGLWRKVDLTVAKEEVTP